jgi:tRNA pseudouridine55 synthase
VDGILNIDKPPGRTSFSIVSMVKRLTGERRVGHAGTLDPQASGVLPVCLGQGTRVTRFLMEATKCYRAEIELGVTTDTYDAWGTVIARADPSGVGRRQLESALAAFTGDIRQTPPMYSAVKHRGRRLYELARAGVSVDRPSRPARVHSLQVVDWQPPVVTVEIVCGKGTYIRSIAHDLGQALGCGAVMTGLVRLRCGPFDISDAVTVPRLEDAIGGGYWQQLLYPVDTVLLGWTAVVVGDEAARALRNGRPVVAGALPEVPGTGRCRAYTEDGFFLGVLRFDTETGQWRPDKVLG